MIEPLVRFTVRVIVQHSSIRAESQRPLVPVPQRQRILLTDPRRRASFDERAAEMRERQLRARGVVL